MIVLYFFFEEYVEVIVVVDFGDCVCRDDME